MECLGELSTMYPGSGSFPHFAGRFIDPSAGQFQSFPRSSSANLTHTSLQALLLVSVIFMGEFSGPSRNRALQGS